MSLAFKIDENLPAEAADLLRSVGHDAVSVLDQRLGGGDDMALAEVCRSEGRALVTLDLDFADIRRYPPERYPGIIVLRLAPQDIEHVLNVLRGVIDKLSTESLSGRLWIADEATLRIRPGD